jgi:hypothetical protein
VQQALLSLTKHIGSLAAAQQQLHDQHSTMETLLSRHLCGSADMRHTYEEDDRPELEMVALGAARRSRPTCC